MRKILLSLFFLVLLPSFILAQSTFKIKGKVTDAKLGEPLIGANVVLKPLSLGAVTDINGEYSFDVPSSLAKGQTVELVASYVNYKKATVKFVLSASDVTKNFSLEDDIFQSDEVVVTGIASKTAKSVAEVAVARLPVADLTNKQAYQGFSQLVSGKMSGINLQTSSGNVGAGWRFFIRGGGGLNGNEQPLYFLDGTQLDNVDYTGAGVGGASFSVLANLNPNDIENIEVLKGPAAAAMYGTNASNGVVLITTKSGKIASGAIKGINATYQFDYGFNEQRFKYNSDWINADRINNLLGHKGLIRENTFTLSGGTGLIKYYTSFQNHREASLIPDQNWMDRNTLRANLSMVPADNLTFQVSTAYTWNKISRPNDDNNTWGWMLNAWSYYPAYNNVDSISLSMEQDFTDIKQFTSSARASWNPIQNLEIAGSFGVDYANYWEDQYYPWGYKYSSYTKGIRYLTTSNRIKYTYDWNAKYNFELFDALKITTMVGAQMIDRSSFNLNAGGQDFQHPNITTIQSGVAANASLGRNSYFYGKSAGIYWQNDFSLDNTYFWTLAIRKDYANAFGTDAPSILYPKASGAIRLDKFDILPSEIQLLKLRAAYGESGQLPGNLDGIVLTWTAAAGGAGTGIVGNSIGNPAVEPERVKEIEAGFDIEFLKMFSFEFTYWNSNASKSLVYTSLANSFGLGGLAYPYNLGEVTGHGFESMLQVHPIQYADYDLNLSFILNYQTSEIKSLGGVTTELVHGYNSERVGSPKHEYFAIKTTTPILDATGQLTGYNNTVSKVDLGNPIPDFSGSISVNFRFLKNFNLYAFGEYGLNNKIYSYSIFRGIRAGSYAPANRLGTQLGIIGKAVGTGLVKDPNVTPLTPGTPEYNAAVNEYASLYMRDAGNFIFDGAYFTIRELSLGYNFTDLMREFLPNKYITGINVGMSVRNLVKFSKYDYDYDSNGSGGSGSGTYGYDIGTLPQPRTFNFWFKVGF
ncbi:MAG: TonB-dependent receptor domain-containing protein [Ignavibacteriaceae bacterium]